MTRPAPRCGPGRGILAGPRQIRGPARPGANASDDLQLLTGLYTTWQFLSIEMCS